MTTKPSLDPAAVARFLTEHHGAPVTSFSPLAGGFWSAAYGYRVGADDLVLRLGESPDGFEIDAAAMRFAGPELPVPEVLEIGTALGGCYAISRRHFGRFVENAPAEQGERIGEALARLLAALRAAPALPEEGVVWYDPASSATRWHDWLRRGFADSPDRTVSGWRERLAEHPRAHALFQACESGFEERLAACPERRDLVHGDLLHQNVLVSDDASTVTGVFSWKCSARGDFLYDVAWCSVWSPWHPAIAAANLWQRTLGATDLTGSDLAGAAERHHCYELQILGSHFGWHIWTEDHAGLAALADAAERVLDRGPLAAPPGP